MELRVKEICQQRGMKMSVLAEKMGLNQANLAASLKGNPTLSRLKDLAKVLDVEISELFKTSENAGHINGYIEINGEIRKITSELDLLEVVGKTGTIVEPRFYSRHDELRTNIASFVHKAMNGGERGQFLSGRVGRREMFTLTYHTEMVPDIDESEIRSVTFVLTLIGKGESFEYCSMEYGIEDCDLDSKTGLIQNIINDVEWPYESMESIEED